MILKSCSSCNIQFPATNEYFYKHHKNLDGLHYSCKLCTNAYNKLQRKINPEKEKKVIKKYLEKRKIENPNYYKEQYKRTKEKSHNKYEKSAIKHLFRLKRLLTGAKTRAKKSKLEIDIDIEFLIELWDKYDGKCCLTGIPFNLSVEARKIGYTYDPYSPSIDKINPFKGYTKDNVRLVCTSINLGMNQFGQENFEFIIKNYLKTTKNIEINYE